MSAPRRAGQRKPAQLNAQPTPMATSRSPFMCTVQIAAPSGSRLIASHPCVLLEKMLPSPGTLVWTTRNSTAAPLANAARGQTTLPWSEVIEQVNS
jgi:hypothetical protein